MGVGNAAAQTARLIEWRLHHDPTASEIVDAKRAIERLEPELSDARVARLKDLTAEVEGK